MGCSGGGIQFKVGKVGLGRIGGAGNENLKGMGGAESGCMV